MIESKKESRKESEKSLLPVIPDSKATANNNITLDINTVNRTKSIKKKNQ